MYEFFCFVCYNLSSSLLQDNNNIIVAWQPSVGNEVEDINNQPRSQAPIHLQFFRATKSDAWAWEREYINNAWLASHLDVAESRTLSASVMDEDTEMFVADNGSKNTKKTMKIVL